MRAWARDGTGQSCDQSAGMVKLFFLLSVDGDGVMGVRCYQKHRPSLAVVLLQLLFSFARFNFSKKKNTYIASRTQCFGGGCVNGNKEGRREGVGGGEVPACRSRRWRFQNVL